MGYLDWKNNNRSSYIISNGFNWTKMKRTHSIFANLVIFIIYGLVLLFAYWIFYPYNPLEITTPVKVLTPVVKPGEVVYIDFEFTKNTPIKPEVKMALVDGVIFNLPEFSPINPVGDTDSKVVGVVTVPTTVPCGEYHIHFSADYQMNPLRVVTVEYETERFIVDSKLCAE